MCCCRLRRPRRRLQEGQLTLPGSDSYQRSREKLRQQFREGKLDDRQVEIDVREREHAAVRHHQQPEP
jgi:ATP-dependent protease HslVU (ClpYQ) ATPase subunit